MPLLKPTRGILLNRTHPLARGLVGAWLLNEGGGNKICNFSGNQGTGAFYGDTKWAAGKFGSCLSFDGSDYVLFPSIVNLSYASGTITWWMYSNLSYDDSSIHAWWGQLNNGSAPEFTAQKFLNNNIYVGFSSSGHEDRVIIPASSSNYPQKTWGFYTFTWVNGGLSSLYRNGVLLGSNGGNTTAVNINQAFRLGGADFNPDQFFNGLIDDVMIFNRALTASEVAWLYREPFCMFQPAKSAGLFAIAPPIWIAGFAAAQSATSATLRQHCRLAGSAVALSQCSALCKTIRKITASAADTADIYGILTASGHLPWFTGSLEIDRPWLREVLFNCVSANAFELGVTLSGGWFWVRPTGCTALYRGADMQQVDFANILVVAEQDACEIQPPSYLLHNSNSTYFYVVRRFNKCGYMEYTLGAAVKVSIAANGEPASPQPNNIFCSKTEQTAGSKIRMVWFYCPLEQKSKPARFKIYWDSRTGQVNYDNPLATINYQGRKYYNYQTDAVEAGRNLFAIRAEDADGVENNSTVPLRIDVHTASPAPITILSAETT